MSPELKEAIKIKRSQYNQLRNFRDAILELKEIEQYLTISQQKYAANLISSNNYSMFRRWLSTQQNTVKPKPSDTQ